MNTNTTEEPIVEAPASEATLADGMLLLLRNGWVILAFAVLGALAGLVVAFISPKQYTAISSVYIGQTTDANGTVMAGLNSNPRVAVQLLSSDKVIRDAVKRTGMDLSVADLKDGLAVETPTIAQRTSMSAINFVNISVTDTDAKRAAVASNKLADVLLETIMPTADGKITVLRRELEAGQKALDQATARGKQAQDTLRSLARRGRGQAELAGYAAVVQAAATERQALQTNNQRIELLLLTVEQTERPRLLHEAIAPDSPSGPSRSMNAGAGALAGIVVGIVVVLLRRRLRTTKPSSST